MLIDSQNYTPGNKQFRLSNIAVIFVGVMKKVIASISVLCYFVVTCGVVVNFHYCMDKLASVHFFGDKNDQCGQCGMVVHESDGCCHDEVKVIKLEQDQNKTAAADYSIPSLKELAITPSEFIAASFYNIMEECHFYNHSPPLLSAQDTYLQINVFRI